MFSAVLSRFLKREVIDLRNANNRIFLVLDCFLVNIALCIGLMIKFDASIPASFLGVLPITFVFTTIISIAVYFCLAFIRRYGLMQV